MRTHFAHDVIWQASGGGRGNDRYPKGRDPILFRGSVAQGAIERDRPLGRGPHPINLLCPLLGDERKTYARSECYRF